jgi:hypothetical protein
LEHELWNCLYAIKASTVHPSPTYTPPTLLQSEAVGQENFPRVDLLHSRMTQPPEEHFFNHNLQIEWMALLLQQLLMGVEQTRILLVQD